jgi:hypothetical protein
MATAPSTPESIAKSSREEELYYDSWVSEIVHNPTNVPSVVVICGFAGKSAKDDHVRIYLTPSLTYLCDIPGKAIVHHIPLPRDQFPLGGSYFWIAADEWARSVIHWVPAYSTSPPAQ